MRVIQPGGRVACLVDALDEFGIPDEEPQEPGTVAFVLDTEMTPGRVRAVLADADPHWHEVVTVLSIVDVKGNELVSTHVPR
jgi:hypothetical protein